MSEKDLPFNPDVIDPNQMTIKEITADEISARISPEMPAPTQSKAGGETTPPAPENLPPQKIVDTKGVEFNPKYHKSNPDGTPVTTRAGAYERIKTGRPSAEELEALKKPVSNYGENSPKSEVSGIKKTPQINVPPEAKIRNEKTATPQQQNPTNYTTAAETYLQVAYGIGASFLGPDFRPDSEEEHQSLKIPLIAVLEEKGEIPLTPTQMFLLSLAAFTAKKFSKPTVREHGVIIMMRIKSWFAAKKKGFSV